MRIVFTCGGTAGHINPAIAVARAVLERRPNSEILFIGAQSGMEEKLVPREGFSIETVKISSFSRKFTPKALWHNLTMFRTRRLSIQKATDILRRFRPDIVVGMGGFASYPAVTAAQTMGIPTVIHDSNVQPGLTTSVLARKADRIMVGFDGGREHYKHPERVVVTGTPVRGDFIFTSQSDAKRQLGLNDGRPLVVSSWGSLGAREMNKIIAQVIKLEGGRGDFRHIHSTGSFGWKWMPDYVRELGVDLAKCPFVDMREYIYDMPAVMCAADLVICRAGASTLSEVTVSGTPAIIVPSPNVANNHQEPNARALEKMGGAVVILEKNLTGEVLYNTVKDLLGDPKRLAEMRQSFVRSSVLDATERIYDVIREVAGV